jgi:RNA polymerase sigma-70 factor (ECF subfamily)
MKCVMTSLQELVVRAHAAWPGIEVADEVFAEWVHDRSDNAAPLHEDLYLACACAHGQPLALAAFDAAFAADFEAIYRRFGYVSSGADDVRQRLHEKLFVGPQPRIADYEGRGSLRTWLRVAVTRLLLNAQARETREIPAGEEIFQALPEPSDPENAHIRKTQAEAFRAAFETAVERLCDRDRNVLRYAIVQGLGIDEIARIYAVHRSTAARWLNDAKETLAQHVRNALRERLGLTHSDVASLVRAVQSQLELSLARYLNEEV